jgi:hypothetical protein
VPPSSPASPSSPACLQDYYLDNTHVSSTGTPPEICGPSNIGGLSGNVYLTLTKEDANYTQLAQDTTSDAPEASKCDPGTKKTATIADIYQIAKDTIQIGPH